MKQQEVFLMDTCSLQVTPFPPPSLCQVTPPIFQYPYILLGEEKDENLSNNITQRPPPEHEPNWPTLSPVHDMPHASYNFGVTNISVLHTTSISLYNARKAH